MSDYRRCPGCLEEMMDADTDMCHGCGGCMVFQAKDAPPPAHAGEIPPDLLPLYENAVALAGEHGRIRGYSLRKLIERIAAAERAPSASAPVEVTKEMVERAIHELDFTAPESREHMRRALTAALKGKP